MNDNLFQDEMTSGRPPKELTPADLVVIKDDLNTSVEKFAKRRMDGQNAERYRKAVVKDLLHVAECLPQMQPNNLRQAIRAIARIIYPEGMLSPRSMGGQKYKVPAFLSGSSCRANSNLLVSELERAVLLQHMAKAWPKLPDKESKNLCAATFIANISPDARSVGPYADLMECLCKYVFPHTLKHRLFNRVGAIRDLAKSPEPHKAPEPISVLQAIVTLDRIFPDQFRSRLNELGTMLKNAEREIPPDQSPPIDSETGAEYDIEKTNEFNAALREIRDLVPQVTRRFEAAPPSYSYSSPNSNNLPPPYVATQETGQTTVLLNKNGLENIKDELSQYVENFRKQRDQGQNTDEFKQIIRSRLLTVSSGLSQKKIAPSNFDKALRVIRRIVDPESVLSEKPYSMPEWLKDRLICQQRSRELVSDTDGTKIAVDLAAIWKRLKSDDTRTHVAGTIVRMFVSGNNLSRHRHFASEDQTGEEHHKLLTCLIKDILPYVYKKQKTDSYGIPVQGKAHEVPIYSDVLDAIKLIEEHFPAAHRHRLNDPNDEDLSTSLRNIKKGKWFALQGVVADALASPVSTSTSTSTSAINQSATSSPPPPQESTLMNAVMTAYQSNVSESNSSSSQAVSTPNSNNINAASAEQSNNVALTRTPSNRRR